MKADVHDPGKYSGITLLSQVLKLLERVLDGRPSRIRKKIECEIGEEQQGFRKGRGTTEAVRGEKTRKAREHVYWICRPGDGIRHSVKGNCDGNVVLAGSARSRGQDGGGNIWADEWESHHRRGHVWAIQCKHRPETRECSQPSAIHCGDGANQQESIYERHQSEGPVCRRSGHSSGRQGGIEWITGGVEGGL